MQRLYRLIWNEWFALLLITALAAALRLHALDRLPAGLYHDEAFNGLDALSVLQSERPIFFEANNGREPLFIYLVSMAVACLGRSPLAIRIVAALLGILTVPAAYGLSRQLLGRREALLTAAITTLTFWHLNLSRIGLRAVGLPLLVALSLWWFSRGVAAADHERSALLILAGAFLGLSLYTYIAARFVLIAFAFMSLYLLARGRIRWRQVAVFFAAAFVVSLPLLLYFARHLDVFLLRSSQVSVFNPAINHGDLGGTLWRHLLKTLGMFNWRGDFIPRHNLPLRPVFDPVMGLFFLLGLVVSVRRARHKMEYALLLIYTLFMLVPTVIAEDAPHFLRSVGILPVILVFPAIGLAAAVDALRTRAPAGVTAAAVILVVAWSGYATARDYFGRHMPSEAVYYNFETGAAELAADINAFLGTGWQSGAAWHVPQTDPNPRRAVYLDARLWRDYASLRYLVPATGGLHVLGDETPMPSDASEVKIIVWPYVEYSHHLALLPLEHVISVGPGPLARGDLEKEARLLSLSYTASPAGGVPFNLGASFEGAIELLGYELEPDHDQTRLTLYWRAGATLDADYTIFVHWLRGGQPIAQSDSYPAEGYYPTHLWRAGDTVVDEHLLAATSSAGSGDSISVGLYLLQTMQRLQVLDKSGKAIADSVTIVLP